MKQRQILVVEDERELARLVEIHLRDAGYGVTLAHDGLAGLKLATSQTFDCIILDLMLPGIDGLEVCQRLRRQGGYTPILMLTAIHTTTSLRFGPDEAYLPVDDFVDKPIDPEVLLEKVGALVPKA